MGTISTYPLPGNGCMPKPCIFLIDDDVSVLRAVGRLVRSHGYEVSTFSSGIQGAEAICKEPPDCVIVDVQMPEINGLDLMNEVITSGVRVPFVFITGFPKIEDRAAAMAAGAVAFIEKPFDADNLLDKLHEIVEGASE